MTDLNALVVFAQVVAANSFSEASRRLKMPTSTVSRRIVDLEDQLGVRLLERSTRKLRLTDAGAEVLEHAQQGAQLSEAVSAIASNYSASIAGKLRLSALPSISDSLLTPLILRFRKKYPDVFVRVLVSERDVDAIEDGVDLIFRIGQLKDSSLVGKKLLRYRHQLLASPAYLKRAPAVSHPRDLLKHSLLCFARWKPKDRWVFEHVHTKESQTVFFEPCLSINDYAGLAPAIAAGAGIGELPPVVLPGLSRKRGLVEVMPRWHLQIFDLWLLHLPSRNVSRVVRAFRDFAADEAPRMFANLPV